MKKTTKFREANKRLVLVKQAIKPLTDPALTTVVGGMPTDIPETHCRTCSCRDC